MDLRDDHLGYRKRSQDRYDMAVNACNLHSDERCREHFIFDPFDLLVLARRIGIWSWPPGPHRKVQRQYDLSVLR